MAMKSILDTLDGLSDEKKAEYKHDKDSGKYILDVEDLDAHPGVGSLKRAKDHEKKSRSEAETKLRELTESLRTLTEERNDMLRGAIPKGDVEKLEGSWKAKLEARERELSTQIESLTGELNRTTVDATAATMASKISKSPELLLPHIKSRLKMDFENGKAVTRVTDADGKVSALTVAELEKEMIANPSYAAIIIGSKATGGGANGGSGGSGAPQKLDYTKASPKEIAAHIKATKENGA